MGYRTKDYDKIQDTGGGIIPLANKDELGRVK